MVCCHGDSIADPVQYANCYNYQVCNFANLVYLPIDNMQGMADTVNVANTIKRARKSSLFSKMLTLGIPASELTRKKRVKADARLRAIKARKVEADFDLWKSVW